MCNWLLGFYRNRSVSDSFHMLGGKSFRPLDQLIIDQFTILERAEAIALNAAEVNKNILALGTENKPEALLRIKPLDRTICHGRPPNRNDRQARDAQKLFDYKNIA